MKYILLTILLTISVPVLAAYELHIEKKDGITLLIWLELCESDSTLTHKKTISLTNPKTNEVISIESDGMCVWEAKGSHSSFDFRNGKISFKHSDDALIKAKEIASKLKANIIGDEGENY